jgi:hypothetical protein
MSSVRISELHDLLNGPKGKDIHMVHYNKVPVQGPNMKTYPLLKLKVDQAH